MIFERSDATSEKRVRECAGAGIKLLMPQHPLTLQNLLVNENISVEEWVIATVTVFYEFACSKLLMGNIVTSFASKLKFIKDQCRVSYCSS